MNFVCLFPFLLSYFYWQVFFFKDLSFLLNSLNHNQQLRANSRSDHQILELLLLLFCRSTLSLLLSVLGCLPIITIPNKVVCQVLFQNHPNLFKLYLLVLLFHSFLYIYCRWSFHPYFS